MCDIRDENGEAPPRSGGVTGFVDELVVAMTNSRIYDESHPRVRSSVEALSRTLEAQFKEQDRDTIIVGAADGYLFYDQRPLLAASRSAPRLLAILSRLGSGGLAFERGTDADDLSGLIRFLQDEKQIVEHAQEANDALTQLGCRHIRLLSGYHVMDGTAGTGDFAGALLGRPDAPVVVNRDHMLEVPRRLHQNLFDHLTNVSTRVVRGDALDSERDVPGRGGHPRPADRRRHVDAVGLALRGHGSRPVPIPPLDPRSVHRARLRAAPHRRRHTPPSDRDGRPPARRREGSRSVRGAALQGPPLEGAVRGDAAAPGAWSSNPARPQQRGSAGHHRELHAPPHVGRGRLPEHPLPDRGEEHLDRHPDREDHSTCTRRSRATGRTAIPSPRSAPTAR